VCHIGGCVRVAAASQKVGKGRVTTGRMDDRLTQASYSSSEGGSSFAESEHGRSSLEQAAGGLSGLVSSFFKIQVE